MGNKLISLASGGLSGFFVNNGIDSIMEYANSKAVILEKLISDHPELTKELYQIAQDTATNMVGYEDIGRGIANTVLAGISGACAIYYANKGDKNEQSI